MIRDFFTLLKLKQELEQFIGMEVVNFFSQEKDVVVLSLAASEDNTHNIIMSLLPDNSAIYVNNSFAKAKSNVTTLFIDILNDRLQAIDILQNDRILKFTFIKFTLYFCPFGGNNSNLFICGKNNKILFVSKNKEFYINSVLNLKDFLNNQLVEFIDYNPNAPLLEALVKSNLHLNKYYAKEFLAELNIPEDKFLSSININALYDKIINFCNNILSYNEVYIYEADNKPNKKLLSLIPLKNYVLLKTYNSVSDAIKFIQIDNLIQYNTNKILRELLPKLQRDEKKLLDSIKNSENYEESIVRANNYRQYAELLMAQPNVKIKIGDKIELNDWNGKQVEIKLDNKLTILDNANKYFSKYKKSLAEADIKQKRVPILKNKLKIIQDNINLINNAKNLKELQKIRNNLIQDTIVIMQQETQPINIKFRVFELDENYTLYVGKNAANNDELTMKFAKPNDIWLHARGSSGSHCVIKSKSNKNEKIPKIILQKAAEIAAYYSGAKNAKYTPVCYTQKKYVHKPKNANTGAVVLQREEIIMVEPKLPKNEE